MVLAYALLQGTQTRATSATHTPGLARVTLVFITEPYKGEETNEPTCQYL